MTSEGTARTRLLVLGAGPGGYPAAFLAAELGMDVTLVDPEVNPGGVCLYRGCIPSKTLLHVARIRTETQEASEWGVRYEPPQVDLDQLRGWKDRVVGRLTGGLGLLVQQRKVKYVRGRGQFKGSNTLHVTTTEGEITSVEFDYAIIATGSSPIIPPPMQINSPRVMDSTEALEIRDIPDSLLVIGGGYIGLEMATVYTSLGSKVTVVEMAPSLLPAADRDLVQILERRLRSTIHEILLNTRVAELTEEEGGIRVKLTGTDLEEPERVFNKVLISVGRRPNSENLGLEHTGVTVGERGFIQVDLSRRTADPHIYAIGDVVGEPMLAHKATHEARVAVEAIHGEPVTFEPAAIPAVIFTDPELAWTGLTETEAAAKRIDVEIAKFPWGASGRATANGRNDGVTKLILEPGTQRVLGMGVVGTGAGELIAEATLAVEMGARAEDMRLTIHAHPTLSETVMESAEVYFGQSPHYVTRRAR